jgi:hypothetical protein
MRQMAFPCSGMNVKYLMAFKVLCASIRLMRGEQNAFGEMRKMVEISHFFPTFLSAPPDLHHFKGTHKFQTED